MLQVLGLATANTAQWHEVIHLGSESDSVSLLCSGHLSPHQSEHLPGPQAQALEEPEGHGHQVAKLLA